MRLRVARHRAGLTQAELAGHLGISRGAVTNWEAADRSFPTTERLQRIALLTGVSFEWLATERGPVAAEVKEDHVPTADAEFVEDPLELRLLRAFRASSRREHLRIVGFAEARALRKVHAV